MVVREIELPITRTASCRVWIPANWIPPTGAAVRRMYVASAPASSFCAMGRKPIGLNSSRARSISYSAPTHHLVDRVGLPADPRRERTAHGFAPRKIRCAKASLTIATLGVRDCRGRQNHDRPTRELSMVLK